MALLVIKKIVTLGMDEEFSGTDWQVSRNKDFTDLIVDIKKDLVNKTRLQIALRDPITNDIVDGYDGVYARVRQWYGPQPTAWEIMEPCYVDGRIIVTLTDKQESDLREIGKNKSFGGADWQIAKDTLFANIILNVEKDPKARTLLDVNLSDAVTKEVLDEHKSIYIRVRHYYNGVATDWVSVSQYQLKKYLNNDGSTN